MTGSPGGGGGAAPPWGDTRFRSWGASAAAGAAAQGGSGARSTEVWRSSRAYRVDIAFRMLGDVGAAEDVVQEAFVRLSNTEPGEIQDERGWLTVVTGRLCLDQIRSARARRERTQETAVLESLQPSAPDPADRITLDDSVRTA